MLRNDLLQKGIFSLFWIAFILYLVYRIALIFFPIQDAGGVEGNIIYFIQRLLNGQTLYTDPEKPPFAIAQYSPAYYYFVAGIARFAGTGHDDLLQLFLINRMAGLFFNLACLFIIYKTCRKVFDISGELSGIVSVLCFVLFEITSFARPDSLYHCFFCLSLFGMMRYVKEAPGPDKALRFLLLSGLIAGLTLFVKQTAIVLPFVSVVWLLYIKKYRHLVYYGLVYLAAVLIVTAIMAGFTNLEYLYKNVILGVNNGISPGWYRQNIVYPFYMKQGFWLLLLLAAMLLFTRKSTGELIRFCRTTLIVLFFSLNAIMLKNGSNSGYLTEWWTLLLMVSAYIVHDLIQTKRRKELSVITVLFCTLLLVKLGRDINAISNTLSAKQREAAMAHFKEQQYFAEKIKERFQGSDQFVLFLNIYTPDSYLENLLFKNIITPQMDIMVLSAYPQKKYDYSDFAKSLHDGRIQWMVTDTSRKNTNFFDQDMGAFKLTDSGAGFNLYQYNVKE